MALWTFVDANGLGLSWKDDDGDVSAWDDGDKFVPGEDGFSRRKAELAAEELGKKKRISGVSACYAGTPNWTPQVQEAAD